jgi:hypothetical protein
MREWQSMIPPMKHSNINIPPKTDEEIREDSQRELATFTALALEAIRESAGPDRKFDIAIVMGDPETRELILSGSCCAGCTANIIEAAHAMIQKMDDEGCIEEAKDPDVPIN